ncbi:Zn-dependent hydrolase [Sporosarcina sp. ACRSM]|uniref:Zn-dependent hydrolase n=1 Tax=Sporosarcina sp. ACRSM TaxID=2918216 RepID=UPI001EF42B22|nr:Zn-dependent hydrolase [Sporosarcina sp. ACRSM]MCG7336577.1 Zn-dependent hydrolase [Sporosarcina sp. ACRSM]
MTNFEVNTDRIKDNILALATIIDEDKPGYTRRPFTKWHTQSREWLMKEMKNSGLDVSTDVASNLIGKREGKNPELPPIMIGSHTDSVVGGGRFDGIIGVLAGIEIARQLNEKDIQLAHTLLVVDFTGEEASEFGISTIGSRGMVGNLTEEDLNRTNGDGLVLRDALASVGGRPEDLATESLQPGDLSLYAELHIEQGPVLEQTNHELGVVTGIVGIQRHKVIVEGQANHAGTTPMNMRFDALTTASEIVLAIEKVANEMYAEQVVGTVGRLFVEPNGANVVPGSVIFEFEVRSLDLQALDQMIEKIQREIAEVEKRRAVSITMNQLSHANSIIVDEEIVQLIEESCEAVGTTHRLPSGAGHDGNQLAKIAPVGMIFVPSQEGKSHCAEEWTDFELIAKGVQALGNTIVRFDERV